MSALDELYQSISLRKRPEEVAELVRRELGDALSSSETRILDRAARGAFTRQSWGYSSMPEVFLRPVGLARQLRTARDLFPTVTAPADAASNEPAVVVPYIAAASGTIVKTPSRNNFKADRLNREGRSAAGLGELSKRQYNKRFRLLVRMERKVETLEREIRKREYTLVSPAGIPLASSPT
jgi:hypothetical protein